MLFHESTDFKFSSNGWQFESGTWESLGMTGYPGDYSVAVQDLEAWRLFESRGWEPWLADYGACGL